METQKGSSDGEDIPSDFFDDFSKDEFMEGLSVIDSWDDNDKITQPQRSQIRPEGINKVEDLRHLIARDTGRKWRQNVHGPRKSTSNNQRSGSTSHLDNYIKPGSRRDINKTNEAIKKDKEEKVKEYLAKHLGSSDDIRPPGTELDDFFEGKKLTSESKTSMVSPSTQHSSGTGKRRRESPIKQRESPSRYRRQQWSPRRAHAGHSPRRSPRGSPRGSPRRSPRGSPRRYSPRRRSPRRTSPRRTSPRRTTPRRTSPRRMSPRHSSPGRNYWRNTRSIPYRQSPGLRRHKSRTPIQLVNRRSHSHSPQFNQESRSRSRRLEEDDFLYPRNYYSPVKFSSFKNNVMYSSAQPGSQYTESSILESPVAIPGYAYSQGTPYSSYSVPYEYGSQPIPPMVMPLPQPVPAPIPTHATSGPIDMAHVMVQDQVPPPQHMTTQSHTLPENAQNPPADALAKLVADGKLSHEDYLKLAPNKGVCQAMDTHARVAVLNRCNNALSSLGNIVLPNKLLINNKLLPFGSDFKQIAPKFCSPLKRQATTEFHFSKSDSLTIVQRNKQIVQTIITTLGLESIFGKTKKKVHKDMKDAAVQTMKPFCDVCEIRASTHFSDASTSIKREYISSTVHTQVLEQDLVSSKAVFNPSGSIADGAPISIAHMTPAQLVSQLAARAKTFKQIEPVPSSSHFRNPHNRYDYDGRGGGNQFDGNNYNYRY